jgi:predicted ATPase
MGKFDQMQQSRPFSGLAAALDQYCDVLISQLGSYWANMVVNNLQTVLGRDASYLMVIIPKLSVILGNANYPPPVVDGDLRNAVQRIQYLLCQFIETISSSSMVSVTICLDDVQWIDNASIEVMRRLLGQAYSKFFFMACFRHDEMSSTHPFWSMIESARSRNVFLTSVELKNVDTKTLENCMSDLLCISPRLVKPLASIVHTKTKGLPLFVSEMLRSLVRNGLLRVDLDSQRWVWDRDKIYVSKPPSREK